jgi:5-methylcytosine-specific restriction protein B
MAASTYSDECLRVLALLSTSRNVLVSGPPGTGKTRLLAEVAEAFAKWSLSKRQAEATHLPHEAIAIPAETESDPTPLDGAMPAPNKASRKVFRTVFHQNTKHRDFISGIAPGVGPNATPGTFVVVEGTLLRASEHAKTADGASLLIIDEINRGPAVQIFGGSLVAIEVDKRLGKDGQPTKTTQPFELCLPPDGRVVEYALPQDLYVLAAQNQADTSVEPLDVAFLRRWEPFRLDPNPSVFRKHYGLPDLNSEPLPSSPASAQDVHEASVRAWGAINRRIAIGRGPEFRIGHGVLMFDPQGVESVDEALKLTARGWVRVLAHVEEVFFGDLRGVAETLNALDPPSGHPYELREETFADDLRFELRGPSKLDEKNVFALLLGVIGQS